MRKSKIKPLYFNMIEIVLAIAILAFGFASVLGLFPVAIKAVRNSQAEGLASNAVNNIFVYYKSYASALNSSGKYFHKELFEGSTFLEVGGVQSFRDIAKSDGDTFLAALNDPTLGPITEGVLGFRQGMNLFQHYSGKSVFFLTLGSPDSKKTEFAAEIIVWKSQIDKIIAGGPSTEKFTYAQAVELNMEVSWPIYIPYSEREKRHYQFVVTNPDQTP